MRLEFSSEDARALVARGAIKYALEYDPPPDGAKVARCISEYLETRITAEELYAKIVRLLWEGENGQLPPGRGADVDADSAPKEASKATA